MPTASFLAHLENLADTAFTAGAAASTPGVAVRAWSIPTGYPLGTPLYDPTGLVEACDRASVNDLILTAYTTGTGPNAGRIGQVAAGKLALDHMACRERALHARHATPLRIRAWAAARRAGHADKAYGVFGAFAAAVADVYASATAVPNAQS